MRLYRVFPWVQRAVQGQTGHPLHLPPVQGAGRIDNARHYRVLYLSDSPVGAVAEAFGRHDVWTPDLFSVPALPDARRAVAVYRTDRVEVLDLDDARNLLDRELRPSDVVTRDRERTQRWSLAIYRERRWGGIRWWSLRDPDRSAYGLWNVDDLEVLDVTPLDIRHALVTEAARLSNRRIEAR
jgi:hypothetical protein